MENKKICPVCGKKFKAKSGRQKYCSPECSKRKKFLTRRKRYRANPEVFRERSRKYYYRHHEEVLERQRLYRMQKKNEPANKTTINEFAEMKDANCPYDFNCFNCPAPDCVAD